MKNLILFIFSSLTASCIFAEELITVTVSGYGATPEAAERSALQKAVRKAVGEMVDAETIAQNGELIKDKVLSYSDGFVQSKKTISGPEKDEDLGLFSIVIEAKVMPKKLAAKLEESKITTSAVAGEDIWAQSVSKISNVFQGREMLAKLVNEEIIPARLLKARLISPGPNGKALYDDEAKIEQKIDYDAETVEMTYMVEVSWDREAYLERVVPKMTALLEKLALAPPVEVRFPLAETDLLVYPSLDKSFDLKAANPSYPSQLNYSGQLLYFDEDKKGEIVSFTFGGRNEKATEFSALWDKEKFLVIVDIATKQEEFAAKVYSLNKEQYFHFFYVNPSNSWKDKYREYFLWSRASIFPNLILEIVDNQGGTIASKMLLLNESSPVALYTRKKKSVLPGNIKIPTQNPRDATDVLELRIEKKGISALPRFTLRDCRYDKECFFIFQIDGSLNRGSYPRISELNSGLTRLKGVGWQRGDAVLTMPRFTVPYQSSSSEGYGNSNSIVTTCKVTLPYKKTKDISRVKLHWLDDSWRNTDPKKGSLEEKENGHSMDELLSGTIGLEFEYQDQQCVITNFSKQSPAANTGKLKKGDIVVGIASLPGMFSDTNRPHTAPGPLQWDPFLKVDTKNLKKIYEKTMEDFYPQDFERQIVEMIKTEETPLEVITQLLLNGPPDTYVYLLIKPAQNPTERIIVPVLRKLPPDFDQ